MQVKILESLDELNRFLEGISDDRVCFICPYKKGWYVVYRRSKRGLLFQG